MANNRVNCHKCKYYYVTWENQHPHGCKAMGFKSKVFPSMVVFQSSGANCKYFALKNKAAKKNSIIV